MTYICLNGIGKISGGFKWKYCKDMILIGSRAINYHFPDFEIRDDADFDFIVEYSKKKENNKEYLINPIIWNRYKELKQSIISSDDLYTLKISHVIGFDLNWDKHMFHIQYLKSKGCILNEELFNQLYVYWGEIHGKNKRSDLDKPADKFFDNAITFPIDHDDIHSLLIKHSYFKNQDKPTFSLILQDNAQVNVDREKFNQLTFIQKYNLVFEEVAVMSIENRFNPKLGYRHLYHRMLKKFILNHAPLWEALWIIENYKYILTTVPFDFKTYLNNQIYDSKRS